RSVQRASSQAPRPSGHQGILSRTRAGAHAQLSGSAAICAQAEMVGMSDRGAKLEVVNVDLRFGGIIAIKSVSFAVGASELLAIVGPNGAGKTALLNCISGIYRPTAGQILLDGENVVGKPLHKMVGIGVGRAFQHAELFPHLTVIENLLIGRHSAFRSGL